MGVPDGEATMSNPNGNRISSQMPDELDDLETRIKSAQTKHAPVDKPKEDDALLGMAWRLSTELVVSVAIGLALGFGLDKLFGTMPWITLAGLGFGFAAGIRGVIRVSSQMDAHLADVPKGEAMPEDDDLDEDA